MIVSHLSTLRLIYGYFMGLPFNSQISQNIPNHTVVKLVPAMYGWAVTKYVTHMPPPPSLSRWL